LAATKPDRIRRKPERPAEILAAAFDEFVRCGYSATRLEDVAARAGVTKGTIYFHFENKEKLFVQMVHELSKPALERTEAFLSEDIDDIDEFLSAYLDFGHTLMFDDRYTREIFRLLISEAVRFPDLVDAHFDQFVEPIFARLNEKLAVAAKEGKVRHTPALNFPNLMLSSVLSLNIFMLIFGDRRSINKAEWVEAAKDLLFYGLLPRK
jgi:AcrR family transcriptional regulator